MEKVETKSITASGIITTKKCMLVGASFKSAATDAATCIVYNGTSATNTNKVWETNNMWDDGESNHPYSGFHAPWGKPCPNGMYVALTGTTPVAIIDFVYE